MSQQEFSTGFKSSPTERAKLRGLKRNAALDDPELIVRQHPPWALRRIATPAARQALLTHGAIEADVHVPQGLRSALSPAER